MRNRRFGGHKFVRQAPIGPYFVDFLCREQRLVVEVDGATHAKPVEIAADAERSRAVEQLGYRIVRVWNGDIYESRVCSKKSGCSLMSADGSIRASVCPSP